MQSEIRKPNGKKPSYKPSWAWKPEQFRKYCDVYRIEVRYNEHTKKGVYMFERAFFYQRAAAERFAKRHNGRLIFKA